MDYLHILGANVRAYRTSLGLSQEQLAEKSNLHRTYIGAIERGDRNVSLKNIVLIADALGVKPYELLVLSTEGEE